MLKTKKFRRLLAGLLAVLMLSVCLPVGAFATGGEEKVEVTISSVYKDNGQILREEKTFNVTYVDGQELPEYEGLKDFFGNIDGKAEYAGTYDSTLIMSNGTELPTSTYGPKTEKGNNTLVTGYKMKVVVYFNRVEEEPAPEEPTTTTVNVQLYNEDNVLFTDFDAVLTVGASYTLADMAKAANNYVLPIGWVEANPQSYVIKAGMTELPISMVKEAVDPAPQSADYTFTFVNERTGETIHDALDVHVEDVAASVDKYVTDLFADVRLDLENDGYKFAGIRNAYNPDDYAQVTSKVVPGGPYEYIVCFTDDAKVEPADYTFTFVDVANGAEIREYLPVHIADVNTSVDKYVLDLVADARRTLEDNGWVYEGIKNAFNPDEYAQDESLIVPGGPYEYIVCFSKPTEAENVTVNFEFVDMAGNAIMAGTSHTVPYSDDVTGTKVVDVIVDETAELANHSYVLDHMTWVYSDGSESSELKDPVVVPDYDNTTIKVYYAQPAHYTFTFVNDETREEIEDVLTVDIADVKTNVDKYVLDLVAEVRRGLEDDGWTYAGIRNAYNDEEFAQNESLVVPGGPYEYLVCFTKENVEDPTTPSTGDNTTTVTGKDEHPDIAEAKANGTWGAPTATPAAASTIPQTGDSMPVVMLIVIALVAAGAVGGLVVLRKRSHQ